MLNSSWKVTPSIIPTGVLCIMGWIHGFWRWRLRMDRGNNHRSYGNEAGNAQERMIQNLIRSKIKLTTAILTSLHISQGDNHYRHGPSLCWFHSQSLTKRCLAQVCILCLLAFWYFNKMQINCRSILVFQLVVALMKKHAIDHVFGVGMESACCWKWNVKTLIPIPILPINCRTWTRPPLWIISVIILPKICRPGWMRLTPHKWTHRRAKLTTAPTPCSQHRRTR